MDSVIGRLMINGSERAELSSEQVADRVRELLDGASVSHEEAVRMDEYVQYLWNSAGVGTVHVRGLAEQFVDEVIPSLASEKPFKSNNVRNVYLHDSNALLVQFETLGKDAFVVLNKVEGGSEFAVFGYESQKIDIEKMLREWSRTVIKNPSIKSLFDGMYGINWMVAQRTLNNGRFGLYVDKLY